MEGARERGAAKPDPVGCWGHMAPARQTHAWLLRKKKQQAAPHPGGVGHVLRWRAGPSRPSCLSIAILQKLYELRSRQLHALPLLSPWSWKAIEGSRVKKKKERNSASGVARGGPDTTLGLKPDTRRGYGVAARPRTLPPALPATRSGNARSGSPTTTPPC